MLMKSAGIFLEDVQVDDCALTFARNADGEIKKRGGAFVPLFFAGELVQANWS